MTESPKFQPLTGHETAHKPLKISQKNTQGIRPCEAFIFHALRECRE